MHKRLQITNAILLVVHEKSLATLALIRAERVLATSVRRAVVQVQMTLVYVFNSIRELVFQQRHHEL